MTSPLADENGSSPADPHGPGPDHELRSAAVDRGYPDVFEPSSDIAMLLAVMDRLRDPDGGCPWDLEQDFASIAPYTVEEAYEVADAIERGDFEDLVDELGDLLLQVVFHARMAKEAGRFDFGDVVHAITKKMIRRHPHVFETGADISSGAVKKRWDEIKAEEHAEKAARKAKAGLVDHNPVSVLSGIPANLPALTLALKTQKKAAKVGFDWDNAETVLDKIVEEAREIVEARQTLHAKAVEEEIGDLLFTVTNLARHLDVDPEKALRQTNSKFRQRFQYIEAALDRAGKTPDAATLEEMDALWDEAKGEPPG